MAEIAIPIAVLGAMYIISNKKKLQKEGFKINENKLVTQEPVINYPIEKRNDLLNNSNVQTYQGYKNSSENYYQPDGYKKANKNIEQVIKEFTSLTGNRMNSKDIEHNNMVPFFGSKVTQQGVNQGYEGLLDIYTGGGSQQVRKQGIAPLFKPQANMSHVRGTPVSTSFYQERMRDSLTSKMNNVKPWQEIQVGPGLNKGYSSEGSSGFNAGMEARRAHLPKTVDELRVKTNPKISYDGVTLGAYVGKGGASSANELLQKAKAMGKPIQQVNKNRPDTYYENSADRWFTTTGVEKAQTTRSKNILRPENRPTTTREYFGNGKDRESSGTYQPGQFRKTHKTQLGTPGLGIATQSDNWGATNKDYGKEGYKLLPNSRSLNENRIDLGPVGAAVNALTAPILDFLRPSRKENVIGNMRPMGNVTGRYGVNNKPVWNPNDTPAHTIREQTENTPYTLQGKYDHGGGYVTQKYQPVPQQRDSTTNCYYTTGSNAVAGTTKPMTYNADYNARTNPNREVITKVDRIRQGNHKLFNSNQKLTTFKNTATTPSEVRPNMPKIAGNMQTHGEISGKNTREKAVSCARNNGQLLQAFNNNPYTHSLHSNA